MTLRPELLAASSARPYSCGMSSRSEPASSSSALRKLLLFALRLKVGFFALLPLRLHAQILQEAYLLVVQPLKLLRQLVISAGASGSSGRASTVHGPATATATSTISVQWSVGSMNMPNIMAIEV
uniref:Uncharacterized protein n=1 Tax=Anopheles coluzzii TaxID=1518534 RepID=A0A8W7PH81_ANOCL